MPFIEQLRQVIGVTYPDIISNKDLYLRTGTKPLSETLFEARWTQFRKVLQLPRDTPAFQAMHIYLRLDSARPGRAHIPVLKKRSGVAPTNLVTLLRSELAKAGEFLDEPEDLEMLRSVAAAEKSWVSLVSRVRHSTSAD